jgi:hypothetical protein
VESGHLWTARRSHRAGCLPAAQPRPFALVVRRTWLGLETGQSEIQDGLSSLVLGAKPMTLLQALEDVSFRVVGGRSSFVAPSPQS